MPQGGLEPASILCLAFQLQSQPTELFPTPGVCSPPLRPTPFFFLRSSQGPPDVARAEGDERSQDHGGGVHAQRCPVRHGTHRTGDEGSRQDHLHQRTSVTTKGQSWSGPGLVIFYKENKTKSERRMAASIRKQDPNTETHSTCHSHNWVSAFITA